MVVFEIADHRVAVAWIESGMKTCRAVGTALQPSLSQIPRISILIGKAVKISKGLDWPTTPMRGSPVQAR